MSGSANHSTVRPGTLWASGPIYRVVALEGEHHVIIEELVRLDDPPGTGRYRCVHTAWLDGGMFMGRLIQEAPGPDSAAGSL